jgi:hypothetical protein
MAFNREQALASGYSEEEIDAYLQSQPKQEAPRQATVSPDVPPPPTTVVATPEVTAGGVAATMLPMGGQILKTAADYALPAAGAYGLYKGGQALNLGREAIQAMGAKTAVAEEANRIARMNAERLMQRPGFGGPSMPAGAPAGPVAPPTAPGMSPSYAAPGTPVQSAGAMPRPMPTGPVMPAGGAPAPAMAAPAAAPAQTVQQMALSKLQQLGGMAQRVAPALAQAAPATAIAAPFMAAGSRVADIQANPNAPEYQYNPRAMAERSGGQMTPAQAGALNRRRAVTGFFNR